MTTDRAQIIAFLGIDGVGKTTQARQTAEWLSGQGVNASYHRNEGARSDLDQLAQRHGWRDIADMLGAESASYAQAIVRWKSIRSASSAMARPGAYVIMDRYVYCQYAAAAIQGLPKSIVRTLCAEFPPADVAFFLRIDPAAARERIERRGTDSDSIELLVSLDEAYRALPEYPGFVVIDASKPPGAVQHEIRRRLCERYPGLAALAQEGR